MGNYCTELCIPKTSQTQIQQHKPIPLNNIIESEKPKRSALKYQDFKQIKILAKNAYGAVVQVKKKNDPYGRSYALKRIDKSKIKQQNLFQTKYFEQAILASRCDFLVDILYTFQTDRSFFIVMEYIQKQDLYYLYQHTSFTQQMIRTITAQVIEGLQFLHSKNIIYRDLKPQNVLLTKQGHIKLTDFGFSRLQQKNKPIHTFNGVLQYMAPQIFQQGLSYDKRVDIWSLGIFLYEIVHKISPFFSDTQIQIKNKIINLQYEIINNQCSLQYKNLVQKLLVKQPNARPSLSQIKQHEFFAGINWEQVKNRKNNTQPLKQLISKININYKDRRLQSTRMNMIKPQKKLRQFIPSFYDYTRQSGHYKSTPQLL